MGFVEGLLVKLFVSIMQAMLARHDLREKVTLEIENSHQRYALAALAWGMAKRGAPAVFARDVGVRHGGDGRIIGFEMDPVPGVGDGAAAVRDGARDALGRNDTPRARVSDSRG